MRNPAIAIVTDSTACIPQDLREELQIHEVAYYIHRGIDVLRDLVTIQRKEFLQWLPTAEELPKTASPGPGDYFQAYKDLADAGSDSIAYRGRRLGGVVPGVFAPCRTLSSGKLYHGSHAVSLWRNMGIRRSCGRIAQGALHCRHAGDN